MGFQLLEEDACALGGLVRRKQVLVEFAGEPFGPGMEILLCTAAATDGFVLLFAGLDLGGNQTVHPEPAIRVSSRWMRDGAHWLAQHGHDLLLAKRSPNLRVSRAPASAPPTGSIWARRRAAAN